VGGQGGNTGNPATNYLDDGEWHGNLYSISSDALGSIERTGMCARGDVPADPTYASHALWGWNIDQEEDAQVVGRWSPTTDAIYYDVASSYGAPLRLNIYEGGSGQTWCVEISDGSGYVSLTDFNTTCWDGDGEFYDGVTPLQGVQVLVPGNGSREQPFDFCINDLRAENDDGSGGSGGGGSGSGDAGVPTGDAGVGGAGGSGGGSAGPPGTAGDAGVGGPGGGTGNPAIDYLDDGEWRGDLYSFSSDALGSIERTGMCAQGDVPADPTFEGFALWGWNINQEEDEEPELWDPSTGAIYYDVDAFRGEPLRLNIYDDNEQTWCIDISDGSGYALLTDFNTACWTGAGDYYDGVTPLRGVQILVQSNGSDEQPFDFCINDLRAEDEGSGGPGGSGSTGSTDGGAGDGGSTSAGSADAGSPGGSSGAGGGSGVGDAGVGDAG
jgi:hypothetical protein